MWIALSDGFLSIVKDAKNRKRLLVRARRAGDIESVFPGAKVTFTPNSDYAYRARIARRTVSKALADRIERIDYPNFKDSVSDIELHNAYLTFWGVMWNLQEREKKFEFDEKNPPPVEAGFLGAL